MSKVLRVEVTKPQLDMLVKFAVRDTIWFEVTPLPNGFSELAVKDEPSPTAQHVRRYV